MITPVKVELFYDSTWNDITADVLNESGLQPIEIIRGGDSNTDRAAPSVCTLGLLNTSGKYSPRNPESELYGKIGRNQPIRVSVTSPPASGMRGVFEVSDWPQRWNIDGTKVWAPLRCFGLTRRLGAPGSETLSRSPLHRFYESQSSPAPNSYWALDSGQLSTVGYLTSGAGGPFVADNYGASLIQPGVDEVAPWLGPGLVLRGDTFAVATTDMVTTPTRVVLEATFLFKPTQGEISAGFVGVTADRTAGPSATFASWFLDIEQLANGTNNIIVFGSNTNGALLSFDTYPTPTSTAPGPHHVRLDLTQSGGNITYGAYLDGLLVGADTVAGNLAAFPFVNLLKTVTAGEIVFSNVALYVGASPPNILTLTVPAMLGHVGESAGDRIQRICDEESIDVTITGSESAAMGPQPIMAPIELMHEAASADGGILDEARSFLGLTYRTHVSQYNMDPQLTVDYAAGGEVAPPLEPSENTDYVQNDVTVTRVDGGSYTAVQETGSLNVQPPNTDGQAVGRYPVNVTSNVESDRQLTQQAGWRKHLGTWDEPLYPNITLDLTAMDADGKSALMVDAIGLDVGERIVVENPPIWQGPDDIHQVVKGYTEVLSSNRWRITLNTVPANPWQIGVLDTDRLDTLGSELAEDLTTTETAIDVTSVDGGWSATAVPYSILVGGELMTVTNGGTPGASQTLTVTRSVNGVVKSHSTGAAVQLYQPLRLSREGA